MEELSILIQKLISTQDEFKQFILNEPDATKHLDLIQFYENKEKELTDLIEDARKKLIDGIKIELPIDSTNPVIITSIDTVVKDVAYFSKKYTSAKIKAVAKSLKLKSSGTEASVIEVVLKVISAEEFEKRLLSI